MLKLPRLRPQQQSQDTIFNGYNWWDKSCLLFQITDERCDYIIERVERVFGREAIRQQDILEIGCGGGLIAYNLAQHGAVMVGIDPAAGALATARAQMQHHQLGQNAYFQQGYAEKLPFADGTFSVIVCLDVLEHVQDLRATIHEIARVLAPGGVFIFDTINRTFLARLVLLWIGEGLLGHVPTIGLVPGLHHYDQFIKPHELHAVLTENGLQVQEMTGFMPHGLKRGGIKLGPGPLMGISYIGYATKGR